MTKKKLILPCVFAVALALATLRLPPLRAVEARKGRCRAAAVAAASRREFLPLSFHYVMGEVIGVAVNAKGHVFLLNRGYTVA